MKQVLKARETKEVAKETINEIADLVCSTLGPKGNVVIIQRAGQEFDGSPRKPHITKDGISVAKSISFSDPAKQTIALTITEASSNTVDAAGDGPQPLTAKVLTPTGFVEMGDVEVGMEVCGINGTTQTVEGVYPKGKKQLCKVLFSDGREVECCLDHLWTVTKDSGVETTTTTREMLHEGLFRLKSDGSKQYKFFTPRTAVEFDENSAEMPLDPYLVGALLGDGSLSDKGSIELALGLNDEHIISKLDCVSNVQYVSEKNYIRVKLKGVRDKISSIGLCNTNSHTKFIPKSYLYSSIENREKLLNGLIDTDGHINTRGLFEYSTVSNELAQDFLTLVRSLGIPVNYRIHSRDNDPNSFSDTPIHRITQLKGYKYGDKIVDIQLTDQFEEMQCIKVSNPDHLYITDNFITTHNTTTTMALLRAIFNEGLKHVEQGNNGISLFNDLKNLGDEVVKFINLAKKEVGLDSVRDVALIAANGDETVADVVYEAVTKVGEEGYTKIEDGYGSETFLDIVEGSVYYKGWKSFGPFGPLLVTDKSTNKVDMEEPAIALFAMKLSDPAHVDNVLKAAMGENMQHRCPVFIVAQDLSDDVKRHIAGIRNGMQLPICAITAPFDGSPNARTEIMYDMAAMTGASAIAKGLVDPDEITEDHLGSAERVEVLPGETIITGGAGDEEDVDNRISELKQLIDHTEHEFDRDNLRIRLAKLAGGVGIIRVGGASEAEILEKKDRVEDALCAARAAIKDGIVPGGGLTLYKAAQHVCQGDDIASRILKAALEAPIRKIIENCGYNAEVKLSHMPDELGYNARTDKYEDLEEAGVIDAALVTKNAVTNAISVAGILLTTGGAVINEPAKGGLADGMMNPMAMMQAMQGMMG